MKWYIRKVKILEEDHVKSMRTLRRARTKRLMTVDEVKEVCRDRSVRFSVLSTPLRIKREVKLKNKWFNNS